MATYHEAKEAAIRLIGDNYKDRVKLDMCVMELEQYDPLVIDAVITQAAAQDRSEVSFSMLRDMCMLKSREMARLIDQESMETWQKSLKTSQASKGTLVNILA